MRNDASFICNRLFNFQLLIWKKKNMRLVKPMFMSEIVNLTEGKNRCYTEHIYRPNLTFDLMPSRPTLPQPASDSRINVFVL